MEKFGDRTDNFRLVITSKNNIEYVVCWKPCGFSYVDPVIISTKKFLWKTTENVVWEGSRSFDRFEVKRMHPDMIIEIFKKTVEEYEEYLLSWKKYLDEKRDENIQEKG